MYSPGHQETSSQRFTHPWLASQVTSEFERYRSPMESFVKNEVWPAVGEALSQPAPSDSVVWVSGPLTRGDWQTPGFIIMHVPNAQTNGLLEVPFNPVLGDFRYLEWQYYRVIAGNLNMVPPQALPRWQFLLQVESALLLGDYEWCDSLPADSLEVARLANGKLLAESMQQLELIQAYTRDEIRAPEIVIPLLARQLMRVLATPIIAEESSFTNDVDVLFREIKERGYISSRMGYIVHRWAVSSFLPHLDDMREVTQELLPRLRRLAADIGITLDDYLE